jgi:hypothetical protein
MIVNFRQGKDVLTYSSQLFDFKGVLRNSRLLNAKIRFDLPDFLRARDNLEEIR